MRPEAPSPPPPEEEEEEEEDDDDAPELIGSLPVRKPSAP
jgi:hypothetical protein